jgi:hypothetical protein
VDQKRGLAFEKSRIGCHDKHGRHRRIRPIKISTFFSVGFKKERLKKKLKRLIK